MEESNLFDTLFYFQENALDIISHTKIRFCSISESSLSMILTVVRQNVREKFALIKLFRNNQLQNYPGQLSPGQVFLLRVLQKYYYKNTIKNLAGVIL